MVMVVRFRLAGGIRLASRHRLLARNATVPGGLDLRKDRLDIRGQLSGGISCGVCCGRRRGDSASGVPTGRTGWGCACALPRDQDCLNVGSELLEQAGHSGHRRFRTRGLRGACRSGGAASARIDSGSPLDLRRPLVRRGTAYRQVMKLPWWHMRPDTLSCATMPPAPVRWISHIPGVN